VQPERKQNRGLEHPGYRRPQLLEGTPKRLRRYVDDCVRTTMREARARFARRQPGCGVGGGSLVRRNHGDAASPAEPAAVNKSRAQAPIVGCMIVATLAPGERDRQS
jgi:hypothetical protein